MTNGDTLMVGSSTDQICDPTLRREHYRLLFSDTCVHCDESNVPDIILRLQDSWSEIRKDCAKWVRQKLSCITAGAEKLLFGALIESIVCGNNSWQAVHGSLLGITELIRNKDDNNGNPNLSVSVYHVTVTFAVTVSLHCNYTICCHGLSNLPSHMTD